MHPDILAAAQAGGDLRGWTGIDPAVAATPRETTDADWQAANRFDRMTSLDAIRVPTLVVGGSADLLTPPKYAAYLASHIPGARLRMFENAGHDLIVTRARELAEAILEFSVE